jgi:formylmethanofuran dehydrogenase subunit E
MSETTICGISYNDFLIRMEEFHGYRSPGILLGGIMVENALRELGPTPYLNVVAETVVCLPDAVQLLTPCTIGNGFLQILDWGKFALTAYDRMTLNGIRVGLNYERMADYPQINSWFDRSTENRQKPAFEEIAKQILSAVPDLIVYRRVRLHSTLKDSQHMPTGICPKCGESYPLNHGPMCPSCQGDAYYE